MSILLFAGCKTVQFSSLQNPIIAHFDKNSIDAIDVNQICKYNQLNILNCDSISSYYLDKSGVNILMVPHYHFKHYPSSLDSLEINSSVKIDRTLIFRENELLGTIFLQYNGTFLDHDQPKCVIKDQDELPNGFNEKQYYRGISKLLEIDPQFVFTIQFFGLCWFFVDGDNQLKVLTNKGKIFSWESFIDRKDYLNLQLPVSHDTPTSQIN